MNSASAQYANLYRIGPYERLRREGMVANASQVWALLSFLESPANVGAALRQANSYELLVSEQGPEYPYFTMQKIAERYSLSGRQEAPAPLNVADEEQLVRASSLVSTYVRHARQYFVGAAAVDYTVRPTMQYYGALALGRAIAASSTSRLPPLQHGLGMRTDDKVTVRGAGEFPLLHDCLTTNFELYAADAPEYRIDVVLAAIPYVRQAIEQIAGPEAEALSLSSVDQDGDIGTVTNAHNATVSTHVLALEVMALFALSHWARYRPMEWEEKLRGYSDGWSYAYRTLLDLTAVDVPLLSLNAITRENHRFGTYRGFRHYSS